jgi:hypothetical protein
VLDKWRLEQAADKLYTDLSRQGLETVEFVRNGAVNVPGIGTIEAPILARSNGRELIVGLHGPLTPDHPADERLREAKEFGTVIPVRLVDEMVISQNLPRASQQVIEAIG